MHCTFYPPLLLPSTSCLVSHTLTHPSIPFKRNEAEARCEELEHINLDLEQRLENQAAECMNLEKDIAEERRRWKKKLAAEENKIIKLRDISNRERKMKQNADDRLRRAEMEIYHILQKKYDIVKEAKAQVKKEMLDSDKIKKDLGIRDRILSQARHITAGTSSSKARHISTPKNGSSEVCVCLHDTTWFTLRTRQCNPKVDFVN